MDALFRLDVYISKDIDERFYGASAINCDKYNLLQAVAVWPSLQLWLVAQGELFAIFLGLYLAKDCGLSHVCVFSDVLG